MIETLRNRFGDRALLRNERSSASQTGSVPYSVVDGQPVFLLITSRRSGRWIFPKGSVISGLTPWDSAAQEALEEAGVEGEVDRTPLGTYRTIKQGIRRSIIEVTLYPLRVERQHDTWPEMHQRHRHWAILPEVKRLVRDRPVTALAEQLAQHVVRMP